MVESNKNKTSGFNFKRLNGRFKSRQNLLLGAALLIGVGAFVAAYYSTPNGPQINKSEKPAVHFDSPMDKLSTRDIWMHSAQKEVSEQLKKIELINHKMDDDEKAIAHTQVVEAEQIEKIDSLQVRLTELEAMLAAQATAREITATAQVSDNGVVLKGARPRPNLISLHVDTKKIQAPKTADTYVPTGSYVKAVLLGGIDVSVGVSASANPRPVLMRLVGRGSLPNGLYSSLSDCRALGSAFGDMSSERAYIRLERLSCMQAGEYRDFPVKGFVTGVDGKTGIRGRVVMRDGELMRRAFVGGFVGGLSKSAANSLTFQSVSPEGSVSTVKGGDSLAFAGAEGTGDALSMVAKYNIKRAEQIQPIIEVPTATHVDVVFTQGFYLDGFSARDPGSRAASAAGEYNVMQARSLSVGDITE